MYDCDKFPSTSHAQEKFHCQLFDPQVQPTHSIWRPLNILPADSLNELTTNVPCLDVLCSGRMHVSKVLRCITRGRTVINAKIVHTRWFYSLIFSHMEYLLWGRYVLYTRGETRDRSRNKTL